MKKRLVVAIILLFICLLLLSACNMEDFIRRMENKGYTLSDMSLPMSGSTTYEDNAYEWAIEFISNDYMDRVVIAKYKDSYHADSAYKRIKAKMIDDYEIEQHGLIIIYGTKKGVKDAW